MKYATFVPDAIVVAAAVALVLIARFRPAQQRQLRARLPAGTAIVLLVAFGIELFAGANLGSYFGGGLVQDRLALFAKAAGLLAAAVAIAVADWPSEESPSVALALTLLAVFGLMVTASAGDLIGVWAGVELAGAAGVGLLAVRRPDLGLRLLLLGAAASAMTLLGLAYVYATAGTADLLGIRQVLIGAAPTLPLALPVLLLLGALAFRAALTPVQVAGGPVLPPASPLSSGLVVGLVAAAALLAAVKVAAALSPVSGVYAPYLEVVAGLAMVGGGAAALAVRTPRARIAFLAAGQAGWVLAGVATHYQGGIGSAVFLLGPFVIAATAGPAIMGATGMAEAALAGMGTLRPHRAAALGLALLSLAGAPPLAGFFGEFVVGSALARSGHFELLAVGLLGTTLSLIAALGTLRVMFLQNPIDEARRGGAALPAWTRLSAGAAVALGIVIASYGLLGNPILGLATQGAEGLGLR